MSRLKRSKAIKDFTKNQTNETPEIKVTESPFCLFSEKIPSPFIEVQPEEKEIVAKPKFFKKTVIMEDIDEDQTDVFTFDF